MLPGSIYHQTPLNTSAVTRAELNIESKVRSNPLAWNGQFSPQLIQTLLREYTTPGMCVFDPFLGSGTVLLEAGRMQLAAGGAEINPAAISLAQTYRFINMPLASRQEHIAQLTRQLSHELLDAYPLFQQPTDNPSLQRRLVRLLSHIENPWQAQLLETLITLLDFFKADVSPDKIFAIWDKLSKIVLGLPFSEQQIAVYHADARQTPLRNAGIDFLITSPPYINVFNYHQQYRASMEALNWDLLHIAKSEIGANRKHRGNRFLTVIQYCLDIALTLAEGVRICCPNARMIFIVGRESTVRGARIYNGEIVAEVAYRALGLSPLLRQERMFVNRFGKQIYEDILHFNVSHYTLPDFLNVARQVASDTLQATYPIAPPEAQDDIKSALAAAATVAPSPIFRAEKISVPAQEKV